MFVGEGVGRGREMWAWESGWERRVAYVMEENAVILSQGPTLTRQDRWPGCRT